MSTTFTVKNTKNEVLSINDLISKTSLPLVIGRNSTIDFKDWVDKNHYNTKINLINNLNIGIENQSLRGVNLFYEKDLYNLKINSPANRDDWKLAKNILANLSSYLTTDIYNVEEKKYYNFLNIGKFNQENEINEGIEVLKRVSKGNVVPTIPGFNLTLFVDEDYLKKCSYNKNEILLLSTKLQWDAYTANPGYLVKKDVLVAGYYVLSSRLETYLPKSPILPDDYKLDNSQKVNWIIMFRDEIEGHIGVMDYEEFVSKNYNLDLIDGNNFKIILDVNQMRKILKFKKTKNKIIEIFEKMK